MNEAESLCFHQFAEDCKCPNQAKLSRSSGCYWLAIETQSQEDIAAESTQQAKRRPDFWFLGQKFFPPPSHSPACRIVTSPTRRLDYMSGVARRTAVSSHLLVSRSRGCSCS